MKVNKVILEHAEEGTLYEYLQEKENVDNICAENGLNKTLLSNFIKFASKGYNNSELGKMLKVHRVTIQRYSSILKNMKESEFDMIRRHLVFENE